MKSTIIWIIVSVCFFVTGFLFIGIGYGNWTNKIRGYYLTNCEVIGYENLRINCSDIYVYPDEKINNCNDCYVIYSFARNDGSLFNSTVYVGTSINSCDYLRALYPLFSSTPCYYKGDKIIIDKGGWYITLILGIACAIMSFIITTFLLLCKLKKTRIVMI